MILNIENNKFLNPSDYTGLNGIWVKGDGVWFETLEMAMTDYSKRKTSNHVGLWENTKIIEGKTFYQCGNSNVWD